MKPNSVYFCPTCQRTVNGWHWSEFQSDASAHKPSHSGGVAPLPEWRARWERRAYQRFALWCCEQTGLCVGRVAVER